MTLSSTPSPDDPIIPAVDVNTQVRALEGSVQSLRQLFTLVVLILILLSASLFIFMLRQVSSTRRQVAELTQFVVEYQKTSAPAIEEMRRKLYDFAKTNSDFTPIYQHYFSSNAPSARRAAVSPVANPDTSTNLVEP